MTVFRKCGVVVAIALVLGPAVASAQERTPQRHRLALKANSAEHQVSVKAPADWSVAPKAFENSRSLVKARTRRSRGPSPTVQVYVEPRLDHADALKQMREFAAEVAATEKEFLEVGGWPALQITRIEYRPQADHGPKLLTPEVLRVQTYVAVGSLLVIAGGDLPSDADSALVEEYLGITTSLRFRERGDPLLVEEELEALRSQVDTGMGPTPRSEADEGFFAGPEFYREIEPGANTRIDAAGRGELEISVSPDGKNVVVALQGRAWVSSNDGGATFPNGGTVGSGNGDPSVAYAQSGNFYIAWIDSNCGTNYRDFDVTTQPPQTFGYDCTGIARSTDDGQSFQTNTVNPAVVCIGRASGGAADPAGACFPDQEHIAADRVNPGSGGGDQVYSTWRNFNSANQDAGLVCSQDSGVTWTAPITLGPNSFFPRINTGQDGFVYVAAFSGGNYRLWKYTSCASGLTLVPGWPVNVTPRTPYNCPFAGHDRCDQNPSSQTVAVDDTNPNHLYYAYAQHAGPGSDSNIFVRDSVDGGATWPAARVVQANPATPARRIFPWLCTTAGDAGITWYEQALPTPSDTTDYYGGHIGLDLVGNLVAKEVILISEVTDNWCDSGWPCGTRVAPSASESCPTQPQLAGICGDGDNTTPDSQIRCDFSDEAGAPGTYCPQPFPGSGNNETCLAGGGCPKYGDYNGNACAGGKLFGAWPSATSPPGVPPPSSGTVTGVLFDAVNLDVNAPVITIPGGLHFGNTCSGDTSYETLEVCNTGGSNLEVDVISSDNPDFEVSIPSSGFPVTISPDFCFPFEVSYNPSGPGSDTATLTVPSDDPSRSRVEVEVTGSFEVQEIVTTFDNSFGNVCLGDTSTQDLRIQNRGQCHLSITNITSSDTEFDLAAVVSYPLTVAPGGEVTIPIEFAPTGDTTPESANISIFHDASNTASPKVLSANGTSEDAVINTFIANSGAFGEVCSGDLSDLNLTVQNDGTCLLEIDSASIVLGANAQAGDFVQPDGSADGTVVEPGNSVQIPIRFAPSAFDSEPPATRLANVEVDSHTYLASSSLVTDVTPITGVVPPPDIQMAIAQLGDYGEVCKDGFVDLSLELFNQGKCDLTISDISLVPDNGSFELPATVTFPLVLSPDADFAVPVRFAPDSCFDIPENRIVRVTSDDPDELTKDAPVTGVAPCPNLVIDPGDLTGQLVFPPTVVDTNDNLGCFSDRNLNLRNNGNCPLTISDISASGADFTVVDPTLYPILLPTGEETLGVTVRFTPQSDADSFAPSEVTGTLTVLSDDPGSPGLGDLCGESAAKSGVRILVTDQSGPVPVAIDEVDDMRIMSKGLNTPSPINLRFTDQPLITTTVCDSLVSYHLDLEILPATDTTGNNPKSSYDARAKEGNLQADHTFGLNQCELHEFQMQLDVAGARTCSLLPSGAACTKGSECCSRKCQGPRNNKTCL